MNNKEIKNIFDLLHNRQDANTIERLISLKERESENLVICKKRIADRRLKRFVKISSTVVAAASIIFAVIILHSPQIDMSIVTPAINNSEDVVLLLSDGSSVVVGEQKKILDKSTAIANDPEKGITYNQTTDEVLLNTLIVPKGKTHKITFEDGTVVTLNSDSRITYPTKFTDSIRQISLQGEAYFEVSKSKKMFIVQSNGVSVKVYGTIFNLNSYDKNSIQTLLVEGSVSMSVNGGEEMRLSPNELGVAERGNMTKKRVAVNKYIAWTNGQFMCEKDDLCRLTDELSRWYGFDFVFEDRELESLKITTIFSREAKLEKIISAIEMLGLKIRIEKREGRYHISKE